MSSLPSPCNSSTSGGWSRQTHLLLILCGLFLHSGFAHAQGPRNETVESQPAPARTGKISGRVTGEDGRPLSDVLVYIYKSHSAMTGPAPSGTTDGEGQFQVAQLAPGLYTANASLPGFVLAQDPATEVGEANYYRPGDSINLTLIKGGVITGTVRQANGEPVVAVAVRAMRVRDATGRALPRPGFYSQLRLTDDRGIYRLYGLQPGAYLLTAGGNLGFSGMYNAYEGEAPTYFPSSTRDTAAEITVRTGEETSGIDIRYRGDRGQVITGTVAGSADASERAGISVSLAQASSGAIESTTYLQPGAKPNFSFESIADGEYELTAQQGIGVGKSALSAPRKVTVKGTDVTGIELQLAPLGSIAGSLFLEAPPQETCVDKQGGTFLETLIAARRDGRTQTQQNSRFPFFYGNGAIPNDQGRFTISNLLAGSYRLSLRLPNEGWYVRSVILPGPPPVRGAGAQSKPAEIKDAALRPVVTLTNGANVSDVTINIAHDAAGLRGRVVAGNDGVGLPANLRIHLVPTERERVDDTLRYSEATLGTDGSFVLSNLAPGRYFVVARVALEAESAERYPPPLAWNPDARAQLRRAAEAGNTPLEFKPCQRVKDYVVQYPQPPAVAKP